jgi:hypothetical protein
MWRGEDPFPFSASVSDVLESDFRFPANNFMVNVLYSGAGTRCCVGSW